MTAPLPASRLPAARGWRWIVEGWRLFVRKPLTWIVFTAITWLFVRVSSVHLILIASASVLLPVILGGWSQACRAAEEGRSVPVNALFGGFRERFRDLSAIGAVNLMGNVVLLLVLFALVGDLFAQAVTQPESLSSEQMQELQSRMSLALVLILALGIPLGAAVWFAPLLVALDGLTTPEALRSSMRGIARNALAFTVYTSLLAICAWLLFSVGVAIGLAPPSAIEFAFWCLMPVLVTSVYAAYRDIFRAPSEPAPSEETPPTD